MSSQDQPAKTDYSKHTTEELKRAIAKADKEDPRIAQEDSEEALEAEREQRAAMKEELQRRGEV
jgi:hypothetical protein